MAGAVRERVERAGRRLRWVIRAVVLLGVAALAWILATRGALALVRVPPEIAVDPGRLTFARSIAVVAVGLLEPAAWLLAAVFLDRLFGLYARGIVFSPRNVALIRRTGWTLVAIDGVRMLQAALAGPVLTLLGVARPYVRFELQISMLIVGLFVVVVSHVSDLGRELDESDKLTI